MANTISFKSRVLPVILLMAVCLTIFFNTLANEFVWDDSLLIENNRYVQDYKNIPLFFTPHYWNELHLSPGIYRPIRTASLAMEFFLWELNPTGYHVTNLLLHVINVVLIFYLLSIIAGRRDDLKGGEAAGFGVFLSFPFLTALFFAAHPIHTESINLIKNRSDLLAFLFFLISFLFFLKQITVTGRLFRLLLSLCAWLSFISAVLSKEMALTLPGVLALCVICFLPGPERKKRLIRIIPYGVITLVYLWFIYSFIRPAIPVPSIAHMPADIGQHALAVVKTMGCYFKMLLVPFPLILDRAFTIPESVLKPDIFLSLTALLLIGVLTVRSARRSKFVFFAFGWIWLTLLPAANIVYLADRPIAEQRLYIPSFGFCLLLGYGIERLYHIIAGRLNQARAVMIVGLCIGVIVGLYGSITVFRNFDWRNSDTLYSKTLAANPASAKMHYNLGNALREAEKYAEAIHYYQAALALCPDLFETHNNLGIAFYKTGAKKKAMHHFQESVRIKPDHLEAHSNLGVLLAQEDRFEDAIRHYTIALQLEPGYAKVHYNLGRALVALDRVEEAVGHFQQAVSLDPVCTEAYISLGVTLAAAGRSEDAVRYFEIALRLDPDNVMAHYNLGVELAQTGRFEEASNHYLTVLKLEPEHAKAHNSLGLSLVASGRTEEAISHYFDAVRLQPDYAGALNNLGLALVATGHAEEAVDYYQAALKIMPDNADINFNLGTAFATMKNYQEASGFFMRALNINPDHGSAQEAFKACMNKMENAPGGASP